jgi:uncharacterized membrane protein
MGPIYSDYGYYIIKQYPGVYFRYYLWPNIIKYYAPPLEFLAEYNMGRGTVGHIGQEWFGYRTNKVKTAFKDFKVNILDFLPIFSGIMNAFFLLGLTYSLTFKGYYRKGLPLRVLILISVLWLANFGFSVCSAPITLRYQLVNMVISSSVALILADYIIKSGTLKK